MSGRGVADADRVIVGEAMIKWLRRITYLIFPNNRAKAKAREVALIAQLSATSLGHDLAVIAARDWLRSQ